MMPHPDVPADVVPNRDVVPEVQEPKEWTDFEKTIVPELTKFYTRQFAHPVVIPEDEKVEMLSFLQGGPVSCTAPAWIDWNGPVVETPEDPPIVEKPAERLEGVTKIIDVVHGSKLEQDCSTSIQDD